MHGKPDLAALRHRMVDSQIHHRGITDPRILKAMETIPRHEFVPYTKSKHAYRDGPLPIGQGQTISQPYITAYMTDLLHLRPDDRVLEVGTGSGYQAALLSYLCQQVYTIEIIASHYTRARKILERLQLSNVHLRLGDGHEGWIEEAPFNGIVVTAAAQKRVPPILLKQLAEGGRLVIPIGRTVHRQWLAVYIRDHDRYIEEEDLAVRFVPLVSAN